ncbi:hypothetical protein A0Y82_08535 [Campylobacter upsaliensis]|nr:hypothetical protein [Campylobacter upsaliensis]
MCCSFFCHFFNSISCINLGDFLGGQGGKAPLQAGTFFKVAVSLSILHLKLYRKKYFLLN